VTQVEDKLRDREGMADLRKGILKTAMDGLKQVSQSVEKAPLADRSMGVALQRMGDVYEQMGQTEEAIRQHRLSLAIFERLEANEPQNDWLPWNRAVSYDKLGTMTHDFHGDATAALDLFKRSLALRQGLAEHVNTPQIPPIQRVAALSVSFIKLASLSGDVGNPAEAREYARRAVSVNDKLLERDPANAQAARFLGTGLYMLARSEAHLQAVDQARANLGRCIEMREKVVKTDPTSAGGKRDLGAAYDLLGEIEVEQNHPAAALELYQRSLALYRVLHQKEPDNAEDQWYLANVHYRLGAAHELAGDRAAAKADFAECLRMRELLAKTDPRSVQRQTELMLAQARCGQHKEAVQAAEEVRKRSAKDAGVLYTVACAYSLCAQAVGSASPATTAEDKTLADKYLGSAAKALEQAIALGYRDREAVAHDPDLAALRTSAGFPSILAAIPKG
jgi:tetratricopeptide (TPR) repeat protein